MTPDLSNVKNQLLDRFQVFNERFAQGAHTTAMGLVDAIKEAAKKPSTNSGASSTGVGQMESESGELLTQKAILKASSRELMQKDSLPYETPNEESSRRIRVPKDSKEYRRIVTRTLDPNSDVKKTKYSARQRTDRNGSDHPLDYLVDCILTTGIQL